MHGYGRCSDAQDASGLDTGEAREQAQQYALALASRQGHNGRSNRLQVRGDLDGVGWRSAGLGLPEPGISASELAPTRREPEGGPIYVACRIRTKRDPSPSAEGASERFLGDVFCVVHRQAVQSHGCHHSAIVAGVHLVEAFSRRGIRRLSRLVAVDAAHGHSANSGGAGPLGMGEGAEGDSTDGGPSSDGLVVVTMTVLVEQSNGI
jgi:hypothetical protein